MGKDGERIMVETSTEPHCIYGESHKWKNDSIDNRGEWCRVTDQCINCKAWRERYTKWDQRGLVVIDEYTYEMDNSYIGVEH